jgi:alanine racemase
MAVVKADAYGHGLRLCAAILAEAGAAWLGVTCVEEGVALRRICPGARILILSGIWHGEAEALVENRLTPVVWEQGHLDSLEAEAQRRRLGPAEIPVHLEIDTGMSRQGVAPGQLDSLLDRFGPASPLRIEAVMTHFHSPDNDAATQEQETGLARALEVVVAAGLRPEILSAGSSAAALQTGADGVGCLAKKMGMKRMLRTGIGLYGYGPCAEPVAGLQPVLSWKTRVVALREVEPGTRVGYDATFTAKRKSRLALLPVGYADGLNRLLSNRGSVLVRGRRAPVAGRISMDHTVLDVTDIPEVERGDDVVLIGRQGEETITAADLAQQCGTISYEILCDIGTRVPRILVDEPTEC